MLNADFLKRLLETFRSEADEHISTISSSLLGMEQDGAVAGNDERLESVYRATHSLKGAARAVGLLTVESLCQKTENLLAGVRAAELQLSPPVYDVLHRTAGIIQQYLHTPEGEGRQQVEESMLEHEQAITGAMSAGFQQVLSQTQETAVQSLPWQDKPDKTMQPAPPQPSLPAGADDQVRVRMSALEALLNETTEMATLKQSLQREAHALRQIAERLTAVNQRQPASELERCISDVQVLLQSFKARNSRLARQLDVLVEQARDLLLLPFTYVAGAFPAMVRNLSRELGKDIEFLVEGSEAQADKRILEKLKDPLIHLLRNAVDHAIEHPAERVALGKPAKGKIRLTVNHHTAGALTIEVADDGKGINAARLRQLALERRILTLEEINQLSTEQVFQLIFRSGLSTSEQVTTISGRGVGMAVVKEAVDSLNGRISITSRPSEGTVFRITVPARLAAARGLWITAGDFPCVIPSVYIKKVVRLTPEEIITDGSTASAVISGVDVPVISLAKQLGFNPAAEPFRRNALSNYLLFDLDQSQLLVHIDEINSEEEFLLRPFPRPLTQVPYCSGITQLAGGKLLPVLDPFQLLSCSLTSKDAVELVGQPAPKILVVDDSLTSRMMLKGYLESAGYKVEAAYDGMAALARLREERFSLVVSDVEMPLLNGFLLTESIRADVSLKHLPVILVTALEKQMDRERGLRAGANAYIVKSSFDQFNLLTTIKDLLERCT